MVTRTAVQREHDDHRGQMAVFQSEPVFQVQIISDLSPKATVTKSGGEFGSGPSWIGSDVLFSRYSHASSTRVTTFLLPDSVEHQKKVGRP